MNVHWLVSLSLLLSQPLLAADNVRFHGALVSEPCEIAPGDEQIALDFGTVIDKYLYLNTRTHSQPFDIRLAECDLSLGKMVKVTFSGNENPNLPGLLALEAGSQANGIGIGMENQDGKPLPLNKQVPGYGLVSGNNTLTFRAYVQGEPQALTDKTIERGPFNAIVTFHLEYE